MTLPDAIEAAVRGYEMTEIRDGESPARVFRLRHARKPDLYLKHEPVERADDLKGELDRHRYLRGRTPVPAVVAYSADERGAYLLVEAVDGENGLDAAKQNPSMVVSALARALAHLHRVPTIACPFDQSIATQLRKAAGRLRSGLVDESDFDAERLGRSASTLFREAERTRPAGETLVITHGDPCLPNVFFGQGRVTGFIDCGRAGLADAYQDLAIAARSIAGSLGEEWVRPFFVVYGLPHPDRARLAFYRLLDEFF